MRVSRSWLSEFVDLSETNDELRDILDDLGLVVEGIEYVGAGLEDVVVARVDEIHAIEGADRIRRIIVDAGKGPLQIVCGAMNFEVGNHVPLAPVGAVLPGDFAIAERKMKGITSFGMLCSGRELGLGDDHSGLLILDGRDGLHVGQSLIELLGITPDVVFDISPEGNRPDAYSVVGIARDLATRTGRSFCASSATLSAGSSAQGAAHIAAPELCGQLDVFEIANVTVTSSPAWVVSRLEQAGMRSLNNVVDASNYVMLELGQPTHPYDATLVAGRTIGVRQAKPGETLVTLDGVSRTLGQPGRGLGDTGVDCVIVDGSDMVIGLAGIMGGESSEIRDTTTDVLLEVAFFDPMTIARTSKRLGLRSEASHRFERGVNFAGAEHAAARFVEILRETSPELTVTMHHHVSGHLPVLPVIDVTASDIARLLGANIDLSTAETLLAGIGCMGTVSGDVLTVTGPASRLDIRSGAAGRADLIEEIARLYSYRKLPRRTPSWPAPGGLNERQKGRRAVRDIAVGLGWSEAWTASMVSPQHAALTHPSETLITITNPFSVDESVVRPSALVGVIEAWAKNAERGCDDEAYFEIGVVATHPKNASQPRVARGGAGGSVEQLLPQEMELLTVVLGRQGDDAASAVASWFVLAERLGLGETEVRSVGGGPAWHPTRFGEIIDVASGLILGHVGEVDPVLLESIALPQFSDRRLGLLEVNLSIVLDASQVARRSSHVAVPSKFPSAAFDLALVTPTGVSAASLRRALHGAHELVESVELFDTYRGPGVPEDSRSLTYSIRLSASDRTLSESDISSARESLLAVASSLGATLR